MKTTPTFINVLRYFDQIFDPRTTDFGESIIEVEKEKSEVESCLSCFPTDVGPLLFGHWSLLLLSLILEVELGQLPKYPKNLSVELLLKISLNYVTKLVLFAHKSIDLDIT